MISVYFTSSSHGQEQLSVLFYLAKIRVVRRLTVSMLHKLSMALHVYTTISIMCTLLPNADLPSIL